MKNVAADGDGLKVFDDGFEIFIADCADGLGKRRRRRRTISPNHGAFYLVYPAAAIGIVIVTSDMGFGWGSEIILVSGDWGGWNGGKRRISRIFLTEKLRARELQERNFSGL